MKLSNIDKLCFFAKEDQTYTNDRGMKFEIDKEGKVLDFNECHVNYGFHPDGVNLYFGFTKAVVARYDFNQAHPAHSHPLLGESGDPYSHTAQINRAIDALGQNGKSEITLVFAFQPLSGLNPFTYVVDHINVVEAIAQEIESRCKAAEATGFGKLRPIIRFASEMNTKENTKWGLGNGNIKLKDKDFIKAFKEVRTAFRAVNAQRFLMSFSPALRADINVKTIETNFWPGAANVDVLSGTWYYGGEGKLTDAYAKLDEYFSLFKQRVINENGIFALDEWGGCEGIKQTISPPLTKIITGEKLQDDDGNLGGWETGKGQNIILKAMAAHIATMGKPDFGFDYATLFLQKKWNPRSILSLP